MAADDAAWLNSKTRIMVMFITLISLVDISIKRAAVAVITHTALKSIRVVWCLIGISWILWRICPQLARIG